MLFKNRLNLIFYYDKIIKKVYLVNILFFSSFFDIMKSSFAFYRKGAFLVEHRGVEPLTSTMRMLRAPNCANAP